MIYYLTKLNSYNRYSPKGLNVIYGYFNTRNIQVTNKVLNKEFTDLMANKSYKLIINDMIIQLLAS